MVAGNDVVLAEKAVEARRARIESFDKTIAAYGASVRAIEEIQKYLKITAPFAGVITTRYAHVGTLVGPEGDAGRPLFTLEQIHRLRLVAAVPKSYRQSIVRGRKVVFTVPAYPGETFTGFVARPSYAVDSKTRTRRKSRLQSGTEIGAGLDELPNDLGVTFRGGPQQGRLFTFTPSLLLKATTLPLRGYSVRLQ